MYVYNRFHKRLMLDFGDYGEPTCEYYAPEAHRLYREIRMWSNHRDTDMIVCYYENGIPGETRYILDSVTKGLLIYDPERVCYSHSTVM